MTNDRLSNLARWTHVHFGVLFGHNAWVPWREVHALMRQLETPNQVEIGELFSLVGFAEIDGRHMNFKTWQGERYLQLVSAAPVKIIPFRAVDDLIVWSTGFLGDNGEAATTADFCGFMW